MILLDRIPIGFSKIFEYAKISLLKQLQSKIISLPATIEDEENLSKEELIKLFKEARVQANITQKKLKDKDKEIQSKDKVIEEEKKEKKYNLLEGKLGAINEVVVEGVVNTAQLVKEMQNRAFVVSEVTQQDILEQVSFAMDEWQAWIMQAKAWFLQTPFGKPG